MERASNDTTGDPESLAGRISVREMGSRVARSETPQSTDDRSSAPLKTIAPKSKRSRPSRPDYAEGTVLDASVGDLSYFPSTEETREVFDIIMAWIQTRLEDQPHDIVRSAADAALSIVKQDGLKDLDKKKQVEDIVGPLSSDQFNQLLNLSKQITDYEDDSNTADPGAIDQGVAVNFDDNDMDDNAFGSSDEYSDDDDDARSFGATDSEEEQESEKLGAAQAPELIADTSKPSEEATSSAAGQIQPHEIDAFWLQRQLSSVFPDSHVLQQMTAKVFDTLAAPSSLSQCENDIMELFDFEHFDLTKLLVTNRQMIVWLTRLSQAQTPAERNQIESQMASEGLLYLLQQSSAESGDSAGSKMETDTSTTSTSAGAAIVKDKLEPRIVDLDAMVFEQGSHLFSGKDISLPPGSYKEETRTYEQYNIPAPKLVQDNDERVPISDMPEWTHSAFSTTAKLNRVQSRVFPIAFESDENLLLCAPTGAGKTNVAMLTMLRAMSHFRNPKTGHLDLDAFKIVYVAPLKALVQEQVREFGRKLEPYGIKVSELTGDQNMTKQQISETQVIVTTPEKWDVITRKSSDTSYTNLVRLIIIDEIHLLHDLRGPVLESIVARTIRRSESTGEDVRLVGLSATLPNYVDVAAFLRVDPEKGLFYFDSTYRPCPLAQKFIGITEKKAFKRFQAMNDACYEKVMEYAGRQQMIIFVHSRKETARTARYLRDRAMEEKTLDRFLHRDLASREILQSESEEVQNADLKNLLPTGFAIHHAGLSRADRASSEELFAAGKIQVLVSTATLAWGVNLPAHTVIIKGTQIYNPEKGKWDELSPQDVLQMLGRAGRPQFDKQGEGIIITAHSELNYYMSLINSQLPIESQLMSKLADSLNAEVVLGTVRSLEEAVDWLGYTYLYVRMLKDPRLYRVGEDYFNDKALVRKRMDLAHSALVILQQSNMIKYNSDSHKVQSTELGRIASHFYISHSSMGVYNKLLKPFLGPIELFRIFSLSEEFKYIPVRQEEKPELTKLLERAPIAIKEGANEPAAKINILLQAYISRLRLDGFSLMADMVYVTQSGSRLLRAMHEICLRKGWSAMAKTTLDICKMVENRMWLSSSPLRQFPNCPKEVIKKMESSQMPWPRYFDLADPAEVGQAIRLEKYGRPVYDMIQQFPRLELKADFQPITQSLLRIELVITPAFQWNSTVHGNIESFLVLAEDGDGDTVLYNDIFQLRQEHAEDEHIVEFTVPISQPMPPNYFISVISEKWLQSETRLAVSFNNLILPEKFPAPTALRDLEPLPVTRLENKRLQAMYPNWTHFNKIQTQTFQALYESDESVFIGAAAGSGKTVCAELALISFWKDVMEQMSEDGEGFIRPKALYLAPHESQLEERYRDWSNRMTGLLEMKIGRASGELAQDLKTLEKSDLILATPSQWDILSRRWQRRRNVKRVTLMIADDVHTVGGLNGYVYESVISRMRYMAAQLDNPLRTVALSVPLANGKDLGAWIGAKSQMVFNFSPSDRMHPMEIHLQSFSIPHHPSLMIAMARPTFYAAQLLASQAPTLVFVPDRKQCAETSLELIRFSHAAGNESLFRLAEKLPHLDDIEDKVLQESVSHGIGYIYPAMNSTDRDIVEQLFRRNLIQVLLCTRDLCWSSPTAKLVVIMGTQFYDGSEHRYIDYPIIDVLQMLGRGTRPMEDSSGKALILTNASKRDYYRKFLSESLPIESHLQFSLQDVFIPEISERVIESRQDAVDWLTFTYFYHRIRGNPSYYGVIDNTDMGVNEFLSDQVEKALGELSGQGEESGEGSKLIELEDEEAEDGETATISPLNGAIIAAYYNVAFVTMQTFALSLSSSTKLRGILEIVTSAAEFEYSVPIRTHEERVLGRIYDRVPIKLHNPEPNTARFKAFVLLQAHFSRMSLPPDLVADQKIVLEKILSLLAACVDVLSGEGRLNAMTAMELSQMTVQGLWDKDSPLKQIPYFGNDTVERCKAEGIESVADFINIEEDEVRNRILAMDETDPRMSAIADFVNGFPNIEMTHELEEDTMVTDEPNVIHVTLEREVDEDEEEIDTRVKSHFYPFNKTENWWLVIGDVKKKQLYGIKRVSVNKPVQTVKVEFMIPTEGRHQLALWCVSDSYLDADREIEFSVQVEKGTDDDGDVEMAE